LYTTGRRGPTRTAASQLCGPKKIADGRQNVRNIRARGGFQGHGHRVFLALIVLTIVASQVICFASKCVALWTRDIVLYILWPWTQHTSTTFFSSNWACVCTCRKRARRNGTLDCTPCIVVSDQLFPQFCEEDPAFVQDAVHPVWIKVNPYNKCVQRTHIK